MLFYNQFGYDRANESQRMAFETIGQTFLDSNNSSSYNGPVVHCVHGPPGTGKTYTLLQILLNLLIGESMQNKKKPPKTLYTTTCNSTIEKLISDIERQAEFLQFLPIVVGHKTRVGETARRYSIRAYVDLYVSFFNRVLYIMNIISTEINQSSSSNGHSGRNKKKKGTHSFGNNSSTSSDEVIYKIFTKDEDVRRYIQTKILNHEIIKNRLHIPTMPPTTTSSSQEQQQHQVQQPPVISILKKRNVGKKKKTNLPPPPPEEEATTTEECMMNIVECFQKFLDMRSTVSVPKAKVVDDVDDEMSVLSFLESEQHDGGSRQTSVPDHGGGGLVGGDALWLRLRSIVSYWCTASSSSSSSSSTLPSSAESASIRASIERCIKSASQLFLCTTSVSGSSILQSVGGIDRVIIEEAAQTILIDSLIPVMAFGNSIRHLVLAGDPQQLTGLVVSPTARSLGFEKSLMDYMYDHGHDKILLNVQYRMNPAISAFPNEYFYDGKLLNGELTLKKNLFEFNLPNYQIINLVNTEERLSKKSSSFTNEREVLYLTDFVINNLLGKFPDFDLSRVTIVSPYLGQVRLLEEAFEKYYASRPFHCTNTSRVHQISTIDGIQGKENDVVLVSLVRVGDSVGFTVDTNRINVMLTRAKCCLYIIGNMSTFKNHGLWGDLIQNAKDRRVYDTKKAILIKKQINFVNTREEEEEE